MLKVIILYAPDDQIIINPANNIKIAFENGNCETIAKPAKNAIIPDIAASDIIIIGLKAEGKKVIHPDFKEIIRALKGINLKGRIAGIFSFDSEKTIASLKEILNDSDITIYNQNLYIKNGKSYTSAIADTNAVASPNAIEEWVKEIILFYKDGT